MDSLLDAIVAAPDDDAPRLVWADREGGERGELVVLQCMLARRQGERADRVRMAQRLRELLPRFQGEKERYVRGFVEHLDIGSLETLLPSRFEEYPLLRSINLADFPDDQKLDGVTYETAREVWEQAL